MDVQATGPVRFQTITAIPGGGRTGHFAVARDQHVEGTVVSVEGDTVVVSIGTQRVEARATGQLSAGDQLRLLIREAGPDRVVMQIVGRGEAGATARPLAEADLREELTRSGVPADAQSLRVARELIAAGQAVTGEAVLDIRAALARARLSDAGSLRAAVFLQSQGLPVNPSTLQVARQALASASPALGQQVEQLRGALASLAARLAATEADDPLAAGQAPARPSAPPAADAAEAAPAPPAAGRTEAAPGPPAAGRTEATPAPPAAGRTEATPARPAAGPAGPLAPPASADPAAPPATSPTGRTPQGPALAPPAAAAGRLAPGTGEAAPPGAGEAAPPGAGEAAPSAPAAGASPAPRSAEAPPRASGAPGAAPTGDDSPAPPSSAARPPEGDAGPSAARAASPPPVAPDPGRAAAAPTPVPDEPDQPPAAAGRPSTGEAEAAVEPASLPGVGAGTARPGPTAAGASADAPAPTAGQAPPESAAGQPAGVIRLLDRVAQTLAGLATLDDQTVQAGREQVAAAIRQVVADQSTPVEAKLARLLDGLASRADLEPILASDLRSTLADLVAQARRHAEGPSVPPEARADLRTVHDRAEALLAKIDLQQLTNAAHAAQPRESYVVIQLPLPGRTGPETAEIRIKQEGSNRKIDPQDAHVVFQFQLQSLQIVRVSVRVLQRHLSCQIGSSDPAATELLRQHAPELKAGLSGLGYAVDDVRCALLTPAELAPPPTSQADDRPPPRVLRLDARA